MKVKSLSSHSPCTRAFLFSQVLRGLFFSYCFIFGKPCYHARWYKPRSYSTFRAGCYKCGVFLFSLILDENILLFHITSKSCHAFSLLKRYNISQRGTWEKKKRTSDVGTKSNATAVYGWCIPLLVNTQLVNTTPMGIRTGIQEHIYHRDNCIFASRV